MSCNKTAIEILAPLFRASNYPPSPILMLGAGASFRSGVPTAAEAVKQIARIVYAKRKLSGSRSPERVKPTEWEPWLQSFSWFKQGKDRFAENFPLAVEHLLTPAEFRKHILLELMRPSNEISVGYHTLAEFVMRGLVNTILTTNFDTCLREALAQKQPHIRHINEVNRGPGDYAEFNIFNKCQIVWLHGKAEQYSDKNQQGEINALDNELTSLIRPVLEASPIIVIGYRGAEPSIMEGLFGQTKEGRQDFASGVYWCQKSGEALHPNVEGFARRIGTNFNLVEIEGFDELFLDLGIELKGEDLYAHAISAQQTNESAKSFDERGWPGASLDDLDLDLALSILCEYCQKLGRAPVTRELLLPLMREQGLLVYENNTDKITAGALLLFGKDPQRFFPYAVVSLTQDGKKREIYEENLISQHRKLLSRLEEADLNPLIKMKSRRQHEERTAYPPRALVELVVNLLVHRDYTIPQSAQIEIHPGNEIVFSNPGCLLPKLAQRIKTEEDGRFTLLERISDLRNPALCDIFFGISAMEREGTGIMDVGKLMLQSGGSAAFFNRQPEFCFSARISRPEGSAGSKSVAYPAIPTGIYILNAMPFRVVPNQISIVKLKQELRQFKDKLELNRAGTFIDHTNELWSFASLPFLMSILKPIADAENSSVISREEVEANPDNKKVISWLLRKHWERYLVTNFSDCGLVLERGRKHRAYFEGNNKQGRTIIWNSNQRRGIRREVVKERGLISRPWFENEGFGYEIVEIGGNWCARIKPFYMFTGTDAKTPLSAFTRTARATRRIKFDRNKSVEADLSFWSAFLSKGHEAANVGQQHVDALILDTSFLIVEIPEIGL